jgi:hypothetical protein
MRKEIYAILIVVAVLIIYISFQSDTRKSIFTERLGDMSLMYYETGDAAAQEITNIYGLKDIPLAKGYYAVYSGRNGTMRVWVAEAPDHNTANDAYNAMNSKLGSSGGHAAHEYSGDVGQAESHKGHGDSAENSKFTKPTKVDIIDIVKPDVYMMKEGGIYNYYYFKMDLKMGRVYWLTFDYPDAGYQKAMARQAILKI